MQRQKGKRKEAKTIAEQSGEEKKKEKQREEKGDKKYEKREEKEEERIWRVERDLASSFDSKSTSQGVKTGVMLSLDHKAVSRLCGKAASVDSNYLSHIK